MTPILYEKDEIDFTSQGLGSLVEIYDVDVEEQRNGLLQLTASYPVSGVRYADISVGRIILAKPNQRDDVHAFRIVSTELDISGYTVTIEADSITYDLTHNLVKHLNASGNGQAFMTALENAVVNPSVFTFYSDIATSSTTSLNYVNPMEAIMGTTGSFLQIWGGELKRENRRVAMFNRRGRDNVSTFRLGKNIAGLKYSVDISSLVTRIIPTKSVQNDDQTTTTLEGTPVDSQYINNYEQIYTLPLEFTDDAIKTVADLNAAAKGWFTQSANTGRDKPTVTIDIDVLSLQDSADYQDKFKNLESVSLTDTVTVYVPEYGVNVTAIVNELHYDPILDRVTKMTVGTAKQSFADSSRTQLSDLQDKIISVQNQADAVAVSANGKSTNYYGSVEPSHPQEGDTWFWVNGDKSGIKVFVNGEWVEPVDSDTQEKIANAVTDAVTQAKSHTDEVKQSLSTDIATAKSQAASQASTAEANAKSAATSQFTQAQNALSAAKSDLTNSIASEASARNAAVAAANSQAQTYANQAKADALNAVTKEVTDRQSAVSALDTKATNAVNQAKSDINDTINAISVGGRNLYINTTQVQGYVNRSAGIIDPQTAGNVEMASDYIPVLPNTQYTFQEWGPLTSGQQPWVGIGQYDANKAFLNRWEGIFNAPIASSNVENDYEKTTFTTGANTYFVRISSSTFGTYKIKFEKGNLPTDWTPAPEDVVLDYTTKDNQIKATITQYKDTNDGKVTKAQTDVTTALGLVATKVSQTDYDTKTGDLDSKYTAVKQTADSQATDIVNIKATATSQASKINSISSDVDGTKQSISDIKTTQDSHSDKINQITTDVNGTKQSITDIQTKNGQQDTRMGTIETSVSGVKSDFSTYKTTNDGVVKTAQTTAQTAVDGLAFKVSKTDYDQKTGDLSTKINDVKQTADSSAQTIADIKIADGKQDARMSEIEITASGLKSTVSDLQTTQGKQSGYISTLQQRADGFDATVTKVNNLQVGGRNLVLNSATPHVGTGTNTENDMQGNFNYTLANGADTGILYNSLGINTPVSISFDWSITGSTISGSFYPQWNTSPWFIDNDAPPMVTVSSANTSGHYSCVGKVTSYWQGTPAFYLGLRMDNLQGTLTITNFKFEQGNMPTDWNPAPEDLSGATAKAQLTADNASLALSNYKTDADGRISKAQADIKANADAITQKVSKTVYDQKTGDLTQAVSKAQTTADGVVTTVGNYQTSNDARVKATETSIAQNANDITLRATTADLNSAKSDLDSSISQVKITADGISNFVRDSNGNISSDFQTALSKTSIITGSTLATSIQTQTSSQIASALTDNNGKIISLINQDTSGVQISGKNIVLNGDTTVTGDFYAKGGNFKNLNASNLTVGTLNGSQVNITNINASNIVSGVLNALTANSMTLNAGTINGAAIYVTSAQAQMDGTTQNVRLGINPNWQHQLHIEPVSQSSGWYHYLYAGNDHLFLGAWDGSNSNTYDNKVALFTSGGTSEVDVGVIRISSNGSAIYDDGWGSIDGVTGISMKGSDPKYTSMYIGVGNSLNGSPQGELRVVTNATIGTSNLAYADARAAHWYTSSLAKYKTNISELEDGSALAMINRAGIYKYQFKTDVEADNDKYTFGPVIGDDYLNNPVEFLDSTQEGTDDHSTSWITMKALQEEDSKVEALIARIEELEEKLESVGK